MQRLIVLCLLLLWVVPRAAHAWSCTGHMLVAEIARRHLTDANRAKADAMVATFSASGPFSWTPDFVHAACWPDDLKIWRQYAMRDWHFIDIPYNPEGIPLPPGTADLQGEAMNVVSASRAMITALKHAASAKSPSYVQLFSLVNLLHFIGDVHQPLHAATLFSTQYPNGDRGGNEEVVKVRNKTLKLHALWDQLCQPSPHHVNRPYSERDYQIHIRDVADYLEAMYVFPARLRNVANPQTMANESHAFAVNTSYVGVLSGATLSEEYMLNCKRAAESRVTLAGLRLASILNPLLTELPSLAGDAAARDANPHRDLMHSPRWFLASLLVLAAFLCGVLSTHYIYKKRA